MWDPSESKLVQGHLRVIRDWVLVLPKIFLAPGRNPVQYDSISTGHCRGFTVVLRLAVFNRAMRNSCG